VELTPAVEYIEPGETGRICGHCQLCCTVLPVYDLLPEPKLWNVKCRHLKKGNKGCQVYHTTRPQSCRAWSCGWLAGAHTEDLPRPDKCHYLVDTYLASFEITIHGKYKSVQVWVDPKYPEAWRCTKLMSFLARYAEECGYAASIRMRDRDADIILFPPAIAPGKGLWLIADTRKGMTNIRPEILHFKGI
jgi:hypothetical protein